jgi:hypothetical protein
VHDNTPQAGSSQFVGVEGWGAGAVWKPFLIPFWYR